jgi:plastocyanin
VNSNRTLRRAATAVVALTALAGFTACSSASKSTSATPTASSSSGTTINIKSFTFTPNPFNAKVGDTITVTNEDGTDHELKADDASFDTGRFADGAKTITVSKAGTFPYHCDVHNYMIGVIQVSSS